MLIFKSIACNKAHTNCSFLCSKLILLGLGWKNWISYLGPQSWLPAAGSLHHWIPKADISAKILLVPVEILYSPLDPAFDGKELKFLQQSLQQTWNQNPSWAGKWRMRSIFTKQTGHVHNPTGAQEHRWKNTKEHIISQEQLRRSWENNHTHKS